MGRVGLSASHASSRGMRWSSKSTPPICRQCGDGRHATMCCGCNLGVHSQSSPKPCCMVRPPTFSSARATSPLPGKLKYKLQWAARLGRGWGSHATACRRHAPSRDWPPRGARRRAAARACPVHPRPLTHSFMAAQTGRERGPRGDLAAAQRPKRLLREWQSTGTWTKQCSLAVVAVEGGACGGGGQLPACVTVGVVAVRARSQGATLPPLGTPQAGS
jgi:hypothetical protein